MVKNMFFKIISIICCSLFGMITMALLNFSILDTIIIPDPCAYHGEKMSSIFNLFYKMESGDGYHPFPTTFNFTLTAIAGITIGLAVYKYLKNVLNY